MEISEGIMGVESTEGNQQKKSEITGRNKTPIHDNILKEHLHRPNQETTPKKYKQKREHLTFPIAS